MKKNIYILVIATSLAAVTFFTGCETSDANEIHHAKGNGNWINAEVVQQVVKITHQDTNAYVLKILMDEEWEIFKSEAAVKIKSNALWCAELRKRMSNSSQIFDVLHLKRIADLERKNSEMKLKLAAYNLKQSNLDSFKHEFNQEMDELGQAFKELVVNRKM